MQLTRPRQAANWTPDVVGIDRCVPLADGRLARYINLDNAASTPPLRVVVDALQQFLPYYSSVHRGSGYKSRVSTAAYDEAHEIIAQFVGAATSTNTVIFGKNTTEAINKLAHRYPLAPGAVVVSTAMEHHSNDLPWRARATMVRARVTADGRLDEDDLDHLLAVHGRRVALLCVSGASNVTGFVQPIHRLAGKAHAVGARILVDAAQLAPHRRIDVLPDDDPEHLDFVALSAHKMYAPFGTGALVGARSTFLQGIPEYRGGGTVSAVTADIVDWAGLPDREEAGTPNVAGAVAMAVAAQALMDGGLDAIARHEASLTAYALERMRSIPAVTVYGERHAGAPTDRVGVIPFNVSSLDHGLVSAILAYEAGIGVRNGCFCAHSYVMHLLGIGPAEQARLREVHLAGGPFRKPGMVRVSLGAYNTTDDIDALVEALRRIAGGNHRSDYHQLPNGDFQPAAAPAAVVSPFRRPGRAAAELPAFPNLGLPAMSPACPVTS